MIKAFSRKAYDLRNGVHHTAPPQSGGHLNKLDMVRTEVADDHTADAGTLMLFVCFYHSF
jgi:hypothetical protein